MLVLPDRGHPARPERRRSRPMRPGAGKQRRCDTFVASILVMQRDHILPGENLKATDQDFRAIGRTQRLSSRSNRRRNSGPRHGPPRSARAGSALPSSPGSPWRGPAPAGCGVGDRRRRPSAPPRRCAGLMSMPRLLRLGQEQRVLHGGIEGAAQRLDPLARRVGRGHERARDAGVGGDEGQAPCGRPRSWRARSSAARRRAPDAA